MKDKRGFMGILRFALMLVLFVVVFPHASSPEAKRPLVAYFVTWHATARGFKSGNKQEGSLVATRVVSHFGEVDASAIVRFQELGPDIYDVYDARFLSLVLVDTQRVHHRTTYNFYHKDEECDEDMLWEIANPSANSGLYVPPDSRRAGFAMGKLGNGPLVMRPDGWQGSWQWVRPHFAVHSHYSGSGHCLGAEGMGGGGTEDETITNPDVTIGMVSSVFNFKYDDPKFEMRAVAPNDYSAFRFNTPYTALLDFGHGQGETVTGEWTGEAHRLGKCPCAVRTSSAMMSGLAWNFQQRTGPTGSIPADDPNMQTVDVTVTPDKTPIDPDSNTKVHIRVTTCEGIPVEGAKVEIKVEPQDSSGGHIHTHHRPRGKLNGQDMDNAPACTSPQGQALPGTHCITLTTDNEGEVNQSKGITFAPPGKAPKNRCVGLAGDYQVTATSKRFPDRKATAMIHVGFNNITSHLSQVQNYNVCADSSHPCHADGPWGTDTHPDSENGTPTTIQAFEKLATAFLDNQQFFNTIRPTWTCGGNAWPIKKVSFNDIALPQGGLFDVAHNWKPTPKGHQTHGKGQGGDFNHFGETCPNCKKCGGIPITNAQFNTWLEATMRMTGEPKYGKWDHADLNAVPPKLHLHVDDLVQGVVPPPPASCPADD